MSSEIKTKTKMKNKLKLKYKCFKVVYNPEPFEFYSSHTDLGEVQYNLNEEHYASEVGFLVFKNYSDAYRFAIASASTKDDFTYAILESKCSKLRPIKILFKESLRCGELPIIKYEKKKNEIHAVSPEFCINLSNSSQYILPAEYYVNEIFSTPPGTYSTYKLKPIKLKARIYRSQSIYNICIETFTPIDVEQFFQKASKYND